MMDMESDSRLPWVLALALGSIVVGGFVDLILDQPERWLSFHVIFETLMIVGALLMATTLWLGWWRAERSLADMRQSLDARKAERDQWRASAQKALEGLSGAIDAQFRWPEVTFRKHAEKTPRRTNVRRVVDHGVDAVGCELRNQMRDVPAM